MRNILKIAVLLFPFLLRGQTQGPLMEWYTYDGCLNCYQAQGHLADLLSDTSLHPKPVVLSFHVDYDENDGYVDSLSLSVFKERQRMYVRAGISEAIYTPQVIVNGQSVFSGSNRARLFREAQQMRTLELGLQLLPRYLNVDTVTMPHLVEVQVQWEVPQDVPACVLYLALCADEEVHIPQSGENKGKTLHSNNVVKVFQMADPKSTQAKLFQIPPSASAQQHTVVGFLQRLDTGAIIAARSIPVRP